jgi:hypothetical protein
MSVQRINEINMAAGTLVGKTMQALMGTDKERVFLRAAMARGVDVTERLLKLVTDGITFDTWAEYFMSVNSGIGSDGEWDAADLEELKKLNDELATIDLHEYYETIVTPYLNVERLSFDLSEMKEYRDVMESIWKEEDVEEGVAPSEEVA